MAGGEGGQLSDQKIICASRSGRRMVEDGTSPSIFPAFIKSGTEIHELDPLGWPMHPRRSAPACSHFRGPLKFRCNILPVLMSSMIRLRPDRFARLRLGLIVSARTRGADARVHAGSGNFASGLPIVRLQVWVRAAALRTSSLLAGLGCPTARSACVARCQNPTLGADDASIDVDKTTPTASLSSVSDCLTEGGDVAAPCQVRTFGMK